MNDSAGSARAATDVRRTDIQALRGLAVLMVVLYHVKIGPVGAGYLGVDVFFVISGFLITSLVARGIERGDFRLADFYFRRAKRLLPAAYVTILATAALVPWFLDQQELRSFALQTVGAITFTANVLLWQQTGYFDGASHLKPLLHTWSLSLEEQYYLLLPAGLLLLRRSLWRPAVAGMLVLSVALCVAGMATKPVAAFYLLPTRAWELLIGSAGALAVNAAGAADRVARLPAIRALFYPSVVALLLLPAIPIAGGHPGIGAVVVCLATIVVILRRHGGLGRNGATKALARIGDFSYSLYLVHWPIVALLRNAWLGPDAEMPVALRTAALVLAFAVAYPLYRFVEYPIHRARFRYTRSLAAKTAFASVGLMLIAPVALQASRASTDFRELRKVNYGFDEACEYQKRYTPKPECRSGADPKTLVWGDSYAMHLVPGLARQREAGGVVQATHSNCGPILGLGPYQRVNVGTGPVYDRAWAEDCIAFNRSVMDYLRRDGSIRTVVFSSPFTQYVDGRNWIHLVETSRGSTVAAPDLGTTVDAVRRTVAELRGAGKKVVLIAPPPSTDVDIGACLERRLSGRVSFGVEEGCAIPVDLYHRKRAAELALIDAIEAAGVPVIRLADFLCDARLCRTLIDGTMIYRDHGHLSHAGSRLVAERMDWARLVEERAR